MDGFLKQMWLYELNARRLRNILRCVNKFEDSETLSRVKKKWYSDTSLTKDNYPQEEYLFSLKDFKEYGWVYFYANENYLKNNPNTI